MKPSISDDRREMFEQIEQKQREAQHWESMFPQGGGSAQGPGALTMVMQFQEVDDIDQFQVDYMLWNQEKRTELQREELAHRLTNLDTEGIVSGRGYDDYMPRFQYMLDTISLLGELGELDQAIELANRVVPLAEIAGQGSSDPQLVTFQWILRSDALWTVASVLDQEDLFQQALECMESASETAKFDSQLSAIIQEGAANRYLSLAASGLNPPDNINSARVLLAPLAQTRSLSVNGWSLYFRVLMKLDDYKEAYNAAKAACAEGVRISDVDVHEIVAAEYLSKYDSPQDFITEFGPFACPIYAECKKIYLSEAWSALYNQPMPVLANQQSIGTGFLIGNVVVYEENDPLMSQPEFILHESIHMGVNRGQVYKSEGEWLKAYRDVPTAALLTYMNRIEKSWGTEMMLPDCLRFFVDLGRNSFNDTPQKCHDYIEKMLAYFEKHGQETNSSYECAGIHAGILLEMIGSPGSKEMNSYISHLKVADHKTALEKAQRRVELIL